MTLLECTQAYWNVSMAWNQRKEGPNISVSQGSRTLNDALDSCGPSHPLRDRMWTLQNNIIEFGSKKNVKSA